MRTVVGCAGLLVEDTFCGPLAALPPQGTLHLLDEMPIRAGGCAANVAINLARQGVGVDVAGCVGQDSAGKQLISMFERCEVGSSHVVALKEYATSRTVILLIEGQDRRYLHAPGANRAFSIEHIPDNWPSILKVFYLGGLFGLPGIDFQKLAALLQNCRQNNVRSVVDVVAPNQLGSMTQLKPLLPLIDVFLPNEDEARAITGLTDPRDQLRALQGAGTNTIIVTRGAQGSMAVSASDQSIWTCGAYHVSAVDPSGSGDAFTSGVIWSLLQGWELTKTLRYASALGASATRAAGTTDSVFTVAEAHAFLNDRPLAVHREA
jgi:sugar/nucleoside kinase (ribokinase family)